MNVDWNLKQELYSKLNNKILKVALFSFDDRILRVKPLVETNQRFLNYIIDCYPSAKEMILSSDYFPSEKSSMLNNKIKHFFKAIAREWTEEVIFKLKNKENYRKKQQFRGYYRRNA